MPSSSEEEANKKVREKVDSTDTTDVSSIDVTDCAIAAPKSIEKRKIPPCLDKTNTIASSSRSLPTRALRSSARDRSRSPVRDKQGAMRKYHESTSSDDEMRSTEPRKHIIPLPDRSSSSEGSGTINAVLPGDRSVPRPGPDGTYRKPKGPTVPPDGTNSTVVAQPRNKMESVQDLEENSLECASHDGCLISTQTNAPATVLTAGPIPIQSRSRYGSSRRIWDLKAAQRITVPSEGQTQVDTGLTLSVRPSNALIIYGTEANSSRGLFMQPLLIDHGRRLPIKLTILNHSDRDVVISNGQILARCVCTHLDEAHFLMSTIAHVNSEVDRIFADN